MHGSGHVTFPFIADAHTAHCAILLRTALHPFVDDEYRTDQLVFERIEAFSTHAALRNSRVPGWVLLQHPTRATVTATAVKAGHINRSEGDFVAVGNNKRSVGKLDDANRRVDASRNDVELILDRLT